MASPSCDAAATVDGAPPRCWVLGLQRDGLGYDRATRLQMREADAQKKAQKAEKEKSRVALYKAAETSRAARAAARVKVVGAG